MDHFILHLPRVFKSCSRKKINSLNIQNYIFPKQTDDQIMLSAHVTTAVSSANVRDSFGSPGIIAMVMDMQPAADLKCDCCPPKH